jgi:cell wall-associated NlpC family hydrolase
MKLDPRLNAIRDDLADRNLSRDVVAPRYADGKPARVKSGLAPVWRDPNESEIDTYFYHGESITVFDRVGDYFWCQSGFDRYVGYVRCESIDTASSVAGSHVVGTMGSYRYEKPDLKSRVVDFLPRHASLRIVESDIVTRGSRYVRLSDGTYLLESCIAKEPPRSKDIADAAAKYLGCPYLWGGKSFLGLDCAGLVQNCFRDRGAIVLRDTYMQKETIGADVAVDAINDLARDDLLYLPGHVMIYEGAGQIIHADGRAMMVHRESLSGFLAARDLSLTALTVRRVPGAAANAGGH